MVRRRVAVIAAGGQSAANAAKAASQTPIVFVVGFDPAQNGLVSSLNRPGGNITGISFFSGAGLVAKRLGLLHELVPKANIIAVLLDAGGEFQPEDVEAAARAIGRQVVIARVASERDLDAAFAEIAKAGAGALLVPGGSLTTGLRRQIVALAIRHAIPALYTLREFVDAGGLASYGPSQTDAYRRGGIYVGRILGREAWRPAGRTADEVRPRHQPRDRQGDGAGNSPDAPRPRRRGDRMMKRRAFIAPLSAAAAMAARGPRAAAGDAGSRAILDLDRRTKWCHVLWTRCGKACANQALSRKITSRSRVAGRKIETTEFPALADDLVRRQVAVIVVPGTTAGALSAHAATKTISIAFMIGSDPVEIGLVASLALAGRQYHRRGLSSSLKRWRSEYRFYA